MLTLTKEEVKQIFEKSEKQKEEKIRFKGFFFFEPVFKDGVISHWKQTN